MAATPTARQRRLGKELHKLREDLDATAEEIATRLGWSPSKLSRIENARIGVRVSDVRLLLELYQVDEGRKGEILALAEAATRRGWWHRYQQVLPEQFAKFVALEAEASSALAYATYTVPGLLQDEEYARRTLESARAVTVDTHREISTRVEVRMRRQDLLLRKENPLKFDAIIDESVLQRTIGGHDVMRRQMLKLLSLSELPGITIRVLPLGVHREPIVGEAFILLKFRSTEDKPKPPAVKDEKDVNLSDVVYIDNSWMTAAEFLDESLTERYQRSWASMRAVSLSGKDSLRCISQYARERWCD
ncbi:helix-turn-helix transcriptional regulator [Actinomadura sp. 6K520]|uniref:helix-turn-helix domain-containing protein n=1 Tax=Actinomadura sp. 6K520 TaxID=2530364 RepID=UPI001FB7292E|nr:helix-turn-helix transcriptional regulator [Actinomadura sp. 6K520]